MPEPLKNMYNAEFINVLATAVNRVHRGFSRSSFTNTVFDKTWQFRELKDRMRHITRALNQELPEDYPTALAILLDASKDKTLQGFTFEMMIFPDFVEVYGVEHWYISITALEQFTQQSSGEFAVRPFILHDSKRMMAQMLKWAGHENEHVRRLASEGCRPRLPWAVALPAFKQDPSPILPILETLKEDESEYVRRSVANNWNDIAKDNPDVVTKTLKQWAKDDSKEIQWIVIHALRTLVKNGDADALSILGYGDVQVEVANFKVEPEQVKMGEEVTFEFELISTSDTSQSLMIDYVMHFQRANDKTNGKVFKLAKKDIEAGETLSFSKSHSFRAITTRRYYVGKHAIEIQVNGTVKARQEFELVD